MFWIAIEDDRQRTATSAGSASGEAIRGIMVVEVEADRAYSFLVTGFPQAGEPATYAGPPTTIAARLVFSEAVGTRAAGASAGSAEDPQLVDAIDDADDPAWADIAGAWLDDPVLDDGLIEAGLRVPRLADVEAQGKDRARFDFEFEVLGDRFLIGFTRYDTAIFGPPMVDIDEDGWGATLVKNGVNMLAFRPHRDPEAGILLARLPVRVLGDPGEGVPFTNLSARAYYGPPAFAPTGLPVSPTATPPADEATEMLRPFALGGPEVWARLRGETRVAAPPPSGSDAAILWALGGVAGFAVLLAAGALVARRRAGAPDDKAPSEGEVFLRKYHVEKEVGRGAFGAVWLATHLALKRQVVIKQLHPEWSRDAEARDRFRKEATILAALDHPHVTKVYDIEHVAGSWYLVMEYVGGGSLEDRTKIGPMHWRDAARTTLGILDGLAYIHGNGVLHRDLKPANVLVGATGVAKIADFGVARSGGEANAALDDGSGGTPFYMAPEQAAGERGDARADLYAVGVTFHRLVSGRYYLDADPNDFFALREAILHQPPRPVADLPPPLAAWLARVLAKKPEDRFGTAEAARDALALALTGKEATA